MTKSAMTWITFAALGAIVHCASLRAEDIDKCLEAQVVAQAGDQAGAIDLFNECIKNGELSKHSLIATYRNIGTAYRVSKKYAESIYFSNRAMGLHPDDPWSDYVNRANAYDEQGDFDKALADYDVALKLRPGLGQAYYNRGVTYEHQKKFNKALNQFIEAYNHGLRTELLYERLVVYGLADKVNKEDFDADE